MKTNTHRKLSFPLIAAAALVAASIVIVLVAPGVLAWRDKQVSRLIAKSTAASTTTQREEYLREAMTIGWGGGAAPKALADYYVSIGRYDKALRVLQNWPLKPNYTQLGGYALTAQDYPAAQRYYARAIAQKGTAEAYVGLAAAQFNRSDEKNGCANAAKATKLDLSYEPAQQMAAVCILLNPKQTALQSNNYPVLATSQLKSDRGKAVFLISNRVYEVGEKRLAPSAKTPADWLILTQLASARGDYKLAIQQGEKGIALDASNPELNRLLAESYRALGQSKASYYEARIKALPLDK